MITLKVFMEPTYLHSKKNGTAVQWNRNRTNGTDMCVQHNMKMSLHISKILGLCSALDLAKNKCFRMHETTNVSIKAIFSVLGSYSCNKNFPVSAAWFWNSCMAVLIRCRLVLHSCSLMFLNISSKLNLKHCTPLQRSVYAVGGHWLRRRITVSIHRKNNYMYFICTDTSQAI